MPPFTTPSWHPVPFMPSLCMFRGESRQKRKIYIKPEGDRNRKIETETKKKKEQNWIDKEREKPKLRKDKQEI